jgi:hypothetical protein
LSISLAAVATAHGRAGPPERVLEPDELLADFRIARLALEEGHSGIYRHTPKDNLDGLFLEAEKSLRKPMSVVEFHRVLRPVVAAIRCGHTDLALPPGYLESLTARTGVLPLQVRVLGNTPYVLRGLFGGSTSLAGKEIRSINGVPASRIVQQMLAAASGDGDIASVRMRRISGWAFSTQLSTLIGLSGPYQVTCRDSRLKRDFETKLEGAWEFFQESFDAMNIRNTRTLVLDLRDNGGGADELGKRLLSYLLNEPFWYYEDLLINAREFGFRRYANLPEIPAHAVQPLPSGKYRVLNHANLGIQQPSKPKFLGNCSFS